jgi:hypothetical protein
MPNAATLDGKTLALVLYHIVCDKENEKLLGTYETCVKMNIKLLKNASSQNINLLREC